MLVNGLTHVQVLGQQSPPSITTIKLKALKGLAKNALRLGDGYTALYYYLE